MRAAILVLLAAAAARAAPGMNFPGTPPNITDSYDCAVRIDAYAFALKTQPWRAQSSGGAAGIRSVFDALQLEACGMQPPPLNAGAWVPPVYATPETGPVFFVDAAAASHSGSGSRASPFATLADALKAAAGKRNATIVLRKGTYYSPGEVLGPEHSGLTIQNYNGEHAVVSGGVPLTGVTWAPYNVSGPGTPERPGSGQNMVPVGSNIWVADLSGLGVTAVLGLRHNGARAVRAKYPNGNPELTGPNAADVMQYTAGWVTNVTSWVKPADKWNATRDVVTNATSWPGVVWPMSREGGAEKRDNGEGDWGDFHIGYGGFCDNLYPPAGYWCSQNPPRGNCYNPNNRTSRGCPQTHMSPDGVNYTGLLPKADRYANATGAVLNAWRGMSRWFTNQCLIKSQDKAQGLLLFDDKIGCNQGGEGNVEFSQWYIENVFEELDEAGEFFFNETTRKLYYFFNDTAGPSVLDSFVATRTKVLFNVTGSLKAPVRDVRMRGLEIRDTALTYLGTTVADLHGMPSGGDWALQRSGAVLLEGTERFVLEGSHITRVDGNGVFLSNYNMNATIAANEMSFVGDSAMAAWGSTGPCLDAKCERRLAWDIGPDARSGNQPQHTHVVGNLVREVGLYQKQSSFWFQAVAMRTHLDRNIHFNGPRAGVNYNDGMGGGDVMEGNLLFNCVRESGDHGPFNSWDRVPFITNGGMVRNTSKPAVGGSLPGHDMADGPSVVPLFRRISNNFIVGLYNSQESIDNDDGSSYYLTHNNYFTYGLRGLKGDFGGQWNHQHDNVYGYVEFCFVPDNNLAFYDNHCITFQPGFSCPHIPSMTVTGNHVYTKDGQGSTCNGTLAAYPSDADISRLAAAALAPFPKAAPAPGELS